MSGDSRFSYHARRALTHAGLLVTRYRHPLADTGHLLVGVMLTEGSTGCRVLQELNLDAALAEHYLRRLYPRLERTPQNIEYTETMERALDMAADEAAWLGHHYIGTEHLLLGITRINAIDSESLLTMLDTSADLVRRRVRSAVGEGTMEMTLVVAKRKARLSELSRRVLNAAEQMAVALDHPAVGLGHLLLVLYLEQRSPTSKILRENGLNTNPLRAGLRQRDPGLMLGVEMLLVPAVEQAQSLGSHYTGTEHLLLALVGHEDGAALLKRCGVKPETIHRELEALLR